MAAPRAPAEMADATRTIARAASRPRRRTPAPPARCGARPGGYAAIGFVADTLDADHRQDDDRRRPRALRSWRAFTRTTASCRKIDNGAHLPLPATTSRGRRSNAQDLLFRN